MTQIKNEAFISQQKAILLTEKSKLEVELKSISKFPQYGEREEDNTQELVEFVDKKGMEEKINLLLGEVNSALGKIEKNQYGICQKCGKMIDHARLTAFPAAFQCIKC